MKKVLSGLFVAACLATSSLAAWAVHVTEADPAHFKLEFENDAVKIIRADWGPKESFAGMLELGDIVAVRLAPANFRVTLPDGKRVDRASNLGAALYSPASKIGVENLQEHRVISVLVELKGKGGAGNANLPKIDPLTSDPTHHHLVLENDKVRVLRVTFGPGQGAPGFFDAAAAVIVPLTPMHFEVTTLDGKKAYTRLTFGQAVWQPAGRILPKNLSDMHAEFIVVEPK
ncbi:MAG: hypothetical protein ACKVQA_18995 [Burkholderiales bacterium]